MVTSKDVVVGIVQSVPDVGESVVVEERRTGYLHGDEIIRKADVVVNE
jgi:molecular chaperone GrpE (heat shock protein)